jgi:hypothetical protein
MRRTMLMRAGSHELNAAWKVLQTNIESQATHQICAFTELTHHIGALSRTKANFARFW